VPGRLEIIDKEIDHPIMSGPTTTTLAIEPMTALLVAAGIRAANAVRDSYREAASLRQAHADLHDARQQREAGAEQQHRQALQQAQDAADARFTQLLALADRLGLSEQVHASRPAAPSAAQSADNPATVAAHIHALQGLITELELVLQCETARRMANAADLSIALPPDAPASQSTTQRLLARIAHLGPLPDDIAKVALELEHTAPGERASLLASDLRLRMQQHIDALQQRQVQEAGALIIEQSLKDLGYQIEEIGNTLFVEGGVVHFRRQGWGNHMVRMRISANANAANTANFNVVRAVRQGDNEISVLDHLAEDRWCAEFPALLAALAARGVHLNVTRRLAAGELPVQLVDAAKLPRFAEEEEQTQASDTALRMPLK
jgi:hypothetical protein